MIPSHTGQVLEWGCTLTHEGKFLTNAKSGLSVAARQCGYGNNIKAFQNKLQKASGEIGIYISSLNKLMLDAHKIEREKELEPDNLDRI